MLMIGDLRMPKYSLCARCGLQVEFCFVDCLLGAQVESKQQWLGCLQVRRAKMLKMLLFALTCLEFADEMPMNDMPMKVVLGLASLLFEN